MDKPLSQERLSEEDLAELMDDMEFSLGVAIASPNGLRGITAEGAEAMLKALHELKRLQAIETQQNLQTKYIGFLKSVIRSGETLGKYEDIEEFAKSIKGADTNE